MTHILNWIHKHQTIGWILIFAYTLAVTFPHLLVQDRLGAAIGPKGFETFYQRVAISAFIIGTAVSIMYIQALRNNSARRDLLIAWLITLGCVAFCWKYLSVNNSELIHFVQYAIPGFILIALTRSVSNSLCWIVIMAGFDEGYQFWGIHPDWGIPWDFNDIVLDLFGGALGVLFALGFLNLRPARTSNWRNSGVLTLASIYGGILLLLATGFVRQYSDKTDTNYWFALSRMPNARFWFYDPTWGPREIHSLTPYEGLALLIVLIALYAYFDTRHEVIDS